ncbi:enoyl-CoA hydratase/isomerase family protein [Methylobacterium sp. J-001]|uniref:enoyl-CoA hydratase/isomerase family protein n=1 Tax=Methylobacterium sp. J-001 TaxID=2836609 RepID=UPI001FBBE32C|nr:enoyl-CoA hydratase/isomerase family protein [Methylobacterium sp. J-001]MCJ2115047.1 enoyl-CoA hydratase/isomerase family protein [Methylobacterium sp. J-001]
MLPGAMNALDKPPTDEVLVRQSGGLGRLTLNRPAVLNALTPSMVARMVEAITGWEADDTISAILIDGAGDRGFCAGGDVRFLHASGRRRDGLAQRFWHDEYVLNALIARCAHPVIGIMSGIVIGAGLGLTGHARHRIATENLRLSMPEVGIGLIPDVGATWLLSHAPGEIGTYIGLTGASVGVEDAIALGLADRFIPAKHLPLLVGRLSDLGTSGRADHVEAALETLAERPGRAPLWERRAVIDRCFRFDTLEEIAAALAAEPGDWAGGALQLLRTRSPTSLKISLAALRAARDLESLEDCLRLEFRLVCRILDGHDFYEGVRSAVIDKDRAPRWRPTLIEDVTDETVCAYLDPQHSPEVLFAPRTREPRAG